MSFRAPEGNSRREPITTAVRIVSGVLRMESGKWGLDTDRSAEPDGYLAISDGKYGADDTATSGETLVIVGGKRPVTY